MFNKHFFKVLIIFTTIIFIGLLGVFLVGYLEEERRDADSVEVAE